MVDMAVNKAVEKRNGIGGDFSKAFLIGMYDV